MPAAKTLLPALAILLAGFWIYWPALHGDWLWDDRDLISNNLELRSWTGLWKIWFAAPITDYWPLTWTFLWIEWHLVGDQPLLYHLTNLALHLASGFLLWRLLDRLGLRWGWMGGLLFVIHPLAVESVAWVSEIKNTLSLPFFLLSLHAWLDAEEGRPSGYPKSILYYLAAMLCKTSTVMLPFVLLFYGGWKRHRISAHEVKRTIPYFGIALVLGLITLHFQNQAGAGDFPVRNISTRLLDAAMAVFFYLGKFVLPINLIPIYPRLTFGPGTIVSGIAALLLILGTIAAWKCKMTWRRTALFGFGFFLLNLLPVLGLFDMTYLAVSWVADHFAYLPMIGLIALLVAGIEHASRRLSVSLRPILTGALALLGAALLLDARGYAAIFHNQEALWTYTLARNPDTPIAHNDLGALLQLKGQVFQAIGQYEQAIKLTPNYASAHNNLGTALLRLGRTPEAIAQYQRALALEPRYAQARYNLGNALRKMGRNAEALTAYEEAVRLSPDDAEAHYNLGALLGEMSRLPEAIEQYQQALALDPNNAEVHNNLGNALARGGQLPEAIEQLETAVKLRPGYAQAHNNLAGALEESGRIPEAIEQYQAALQLDPGYLDAHYNLGVTLRGAGRLPEAIDQFAAALKIDPNFVEAQVALGDVLAQTGQLDAALRQYQSALQIRPGSAEAQNHLAQVEAALKAHPPKNPAP